MTTTTPDAITVVTKERIAALKLFKAWYDDDEGYGYAGDVMHETMQNTDHVGLVYALLMYLEKAYDGERFKINRTIRQLQAELDHDKVDCRGLQRGDDVCKWCDKPAEAHI